MGFEKSHLFGKVEFELIASAIGSLTLYTDLPGNAMALRATVATPTCATRRPVSSRLPGSMQGHLISAKFTPGTGQAEIYGLRVWCRELPDGQWGWFPLPVVATPEEYQQVSIPVEATPAEFTAVPIPVEPTPEGYTAEAVPVETTPEGFSEVRIPVEATPGGFSPVKPRRCPPREGD